jgi:hypothetical protein
MESSTKKIILPSISNLSDKDKREVKPVKEKSKRLITESHKWNFEENDLLPENIYSILLEIQEKRVSPKNDNISKCIVQQLNQKIFGYKGQDGKKNLFDHTKFVDLEKVIELLIKSNLECFYCKNKVLLLYEYVREPGQWTLDRIDNDYGHNKDNLEIACLQCNVRRRTMYADRYVFTKQLKLIKKIE